MTKDGVSDWRYIDDIESLAIIPFYKKKFTAEIEEDNLVLFYELDDGRLSLVPENELASSIILYTKDIITADLIYVSRVNVINSKGYNTTYFCASDSVYVMNNNGKTVDKY